MSLTTCLYSTFTALHKPRKLTSQRNSWLKPASKFWKPWSAWTDKAIKPTSLKGSKEATKGWSGCRTSYLTRMDRWRSKIWAIFISTSMRSKRLIWFSCRPKSLRVARYPADRALGGTRAAWLTTSFNWTLRWMFGLLEWFCYIACAWNTKKLSMEKIRLTRYSAFSSK